MSSSIFKPKLKVLFSAVALASAGANVQAAFDDAGTDYSNSEQRFHLWNEALEPIEMVNSILCFSAQMRAEEFVNEGPYSVLADDAACFEEESTGSQSSGASNQPKYVTAIVDAVRDSDTSPLEVSVWLPEMEVGDGDGAIKFKAVISEGASESNPFGQFSFNYEFYSSIDSTDSFGGGEIRTIDVAGKTGFTLFADEGDYQQSASVVMSEDQSEGVALTSTAKQEAGGEDRSAAFALTFNGDNVLMQKATDYASLAFQQGDQIGQCFSRTDINETVHRYDLFNASTGATVELNSGFPFKYDSDSDGNDDARGHVGYWGVWVEGDAVLATGTEITKENFGDDSAEGETYTVVSAPGRLIKKSLQTLPLSKAVGVDFNYWDDSAYQSGYQSWAVRYMTTESDSVSDGFYRVAGLSWGEGGETRTALETSIMINLAANESLYLHSNQLGGQVQYKQGETDFAFFEEEIVSGGETGSGEIFETGSMNLVCLDRCPVGELGSTELADWDSPYVSNITSTGDAVVYSISNSGSNALALVRSSNSEVVQFASNLTENDLNNSAHGWGIQSGAMIPQSELSNLTNVWDVFDPSIVTEFYVWETGPNHWNRTTAIRDSQGDYQSFDKPMQILYVHSDANDRSGSAGDYDGQTFMLNYGGNGDLWGLPHEFDENTGFHRSLANLNDGTLLGGSNQYVVKAREIEGEMAVATGQCGALAIAEPEVSVPTAIVDGVDLGGMPTVTSAPKAIGGELQNED